MTKEVRHREERSKMEQQYIIEKPPCFDLKDTFTCGQCFRWKKNTDNSYTGVVRQNVIQVTAQSKKYCFTSVGNEDIKTLVHQYFDLERNYLTLQKQLAKIDSNMKTSIEYGKGIRLLNQDLWETIVSFIISANNNIPRIEKIIQRLAQAYGKKIEFKGRDYYTFPLPQDLKDVTIEEFRNLGLGFRDKRMYETTHMILENKVNLQELEQNPHTEAVRETLLTLSGVGPKVADCILLFSTLKRLEVFPIDVWISRVMNELYLHEPENKVNKAKIQLLAEQKFGNLAGMAQQYLFYWRRG